MTAITMPSPTSLTTEEMSTICELSALGLKLISEGASYYKIAMVFNDIRKITFGQPLGGSASFMMSPELVECSQCGGYLPNYAAYIKCAETCSP